MDAAETCAWQFRIERVSLSCVGHDAEVGWQVGEPRCALPRATVCHLCVRDVMPAYHPGSSRRYWCGRCQRLDRALARPFGSRAMTPHDGQRSWSYVSLLGRLFPDRVPREVEELVTRADGSTTTVTLVVEPEVSPYALLKGHAAALGLAMAQAAVEVDGGPASLRAGADGDHVVRWAEWARCFPPSDDASARAYQRYVARAHPWIETVEPRVADLEWLVGVLGAV